MLVTFTRNRLRAIFDSLEDGRYIPAPQEGKQWQDSEILALAGACMAELLFRREVAHSETTDEPLRYHLHTTFGRLSGRLMAALNYAISVASTISCGCLAAGYAAEDKTYTVEILYDHGNFIVAHPSTPEDAPDPDPDDTALRPAA